VISSTRDFVQMGDNCVEKIHLAGLLNNAKSVADGMTSHKLSLFKSAVQNDSL